MCRIFKQKLSLTFMLKVDVSCIVMIVKVLEFTC